MPGKLEVKVTYAARRPWVPRRAQFEIWARAVLAGLSGHSVLSVLVVGSARSRSLNSRYRRKDKSTNVLSFSGPGPGPDGRNYLGELVICAPVVAREALVQRKSRESHWAHMTVHGALHLLGFDHEQDAEAAKMTAREIQILDRLGFSNPYV
jgi:probable rRNA maturation factor